MRSPEPETKRFWSDVVHDLTPYVPGEQPKLADLIKLNTNENPYGPSPNTLAALVAECNDELRLYPDPHGDRLRHAIADYYGVRPEQIFLGNGSDEVLAFAFQALLKHDRPILFPDVTYSFYPSYCALYEIEYERIPLDEEFRIRVDDYLASRLPVRGEDPVADRSSRPDGNGGIIFPNPNAPTGIALPLSEIERLVEGNRDSVVVIDEAYVDFGAQTATPLVDRYPNLLITQTLSKSRALAGLRVGFAIGHPGLIEALERIKNSFNSYPLDRFAIAGAAAAFEDREYFAERRAAVIETRQALTSSLRDLGFEVLPSSANFVFMRHPVHDAAELAASLRERSIIVRYFKLPRIEQFLRITVGTERQCEALISALRQISIGNRESAANPPAGS